MRFKIIGGICRGYWLFDNETNICLNLHFTQMWDAIHARDALNRGEMELHPSFIAEA